LIDDGFADLDQLAYDTIHRLRGIDLVGKATPRARRAGWTCRFRTPPHEDALSHVGASPKATSGFEPLYEALQASA
jgi:hypothetical protein